MSLVFPHSESLNGSESGGQKALFNLTTAVKDAAVGWLSLWSDTDGSYNTAVGAGTLLFNVGNQSTGQAFATATFYKPD
jgi:hypothetical protein